MTATTPIDEHHLLHECLVGEIGIPPGDLGIV
jgi:hypothetical protein